MEFISRSFSFSLVYLFLVYFSFAERPGHKGGEVKEAIEGKEEQDHEDPWCKEGKEIAYVGLGIHVHWLISLSAHCYTMGRPRLEMVQRLGRRNEMLWILWLLHAGSKSEEWSYAAAFFI